MIQKSNIIQYTVSELNNSIKKIIEGSFNYIKVKAEISQISKPKSGHIYFTLKDEYETILAVCFRSKVQNINSIPQEGDSVLVEGKISTFSPQSKYQIIIEKIDFEGEGSLLKKLEETKRKLEREGFFDSKKKKKIPFLPRRIGVITSQSGAVIRDIIHRVKERFPSEILIFPVSVQGNSCAMEIIKSIQRINQNNNIFQLDVLIIARGGGSFEDLMPFNDESLVKQIFTSVVPTISAIGHETDVTLCDFVADLSVPTPTAAAEKCVPVKKDLAIRLIEQNLGLIKSIKSLLEKRILKLENLFIKIPQVDNLINQKFQLIDMINIKINNLLSNIITENRISLKEIVGKLESRLFSNKIDFMREKKNNLGEKINTIISSKLFFLNRKVVENDKLLNSMSYKKILRRGFSVTRVNGKLVNNNKNINIGEEIEIEYFENKTIAKKIR